MAMLNRTPFRYSQSISRLISTPIKRTGCEFRTGQRLLRRLACRARRVDADFDLIGGVSVLRLGRIVLMTHTCLISLFLDLPIPFLQLLITLSSSSLRLTEFLSLMNVLFWFLFLLSLYIKIFYYKICLEAKKMVEKMWETSRKITFLECNQTLENIF